MLLIYDLIIRFIFLAFGVIALKLAWEFGLWRVNGKECIKKNMIRLFVAIAWAGFITFIGGAIKIVTDQMVISPELDDVRVLTVRLIASLPLLWAVYKFHKYIMCTQAKGLIKRLNDQETHINGDAS